MKAFPASTEINKILPKETFYQRLALNAELKARFVTDIKHISIANSLTSENLNVKQGSEVKEILLLVVDLKTKNFEYRLIEQIARQNQHHLIFQLRHENQEQLALYFNKLYKTEWQAIDRENFDFFCSFSLDDIWTGFVRQIALRQEILLQNDGIAIKELLEKQEHILKLQKNIDKLEKQTRIEKQPKKKFGLYTELQILKDQLPE